MFCYAITIKGLESIPLRTSRDGAIALINAFDNAGPTANEIVEQVDRGTPFKNTFVGVSRVIEIEEQSPNFEKSLAKVKAKFSPAEKAVLKKAVLKKASKVVKIPSLGVLKKAKKAALKKVALRKRGK